METYPWSSFVITNTFIANSWEWLVCRLKILPCKVMYGGRIGLEKQMYKAGDSLESMAAFLLFLKIVIKTVISVTWLYSWPCSQVFYWLESYWKMGQHYGSWPGLLSGMRGRLFIELTRDHSSRTWLVLHLKSTLMISIVTCSVSMPWLYMTYRPVAPRDNTSVHSTVPACLRRLHLVLLGKKNALFESTIRIIAVLVNIRICVQ